MKHSNKKGFTIVELVIVIAVIAILAAVLIPTFSSLVEKANISNDIALAKNLNTSLLSAEASGQSIDSFNEAIAILQADGFDVGKMNPTAENRYYVWDSQSKQILYIDSENVDTPAYATNDNYGDISAWWLPIDATAKINNAFSNFLLTTSDDVAEEISFTKPVGFAVLNGQTVKNKTISITTSDEGAIILDGDIQSTVVVEAEKCDLTQNGNIATLTIKAIKGASAHINGIVVTLNHAKGHLVIEKNAYVTTLNEQATTANDASISVKGIVTTLGEASSNANYTIDGGVIVKSAEGVSAPDGIVGADNYVISIANASDLAKFRDEVNSGKSYEGIKVELTDNINLGNVEWTAIGQAYGKNYAFSGIFDGNGKTISGLKFVGTEDDAEYGWGSLFGRADSKSTIKNLTVEGTVSGTNVAGIAAILGGTMENCTSKVVVNCTEKAGGIVCRFDGGSIKNCTNEGVVTGGNSGIAGIAGYINKSNGTIDNCVNNANIGTGSEKIVGGIVGCQPASLTVTNCTNNGVVNGGASAGGAGGIVGCVQGTNTKLTLTDCINNGNVITAHHIAGGIVGQTNGDDVKTITIKITNCTNKGTITVSGKGSDTHYGQTSFAGAIIGQTWAQLTVDNCKVEGNPVLTADHCGMIGYSREGTTTIKNTSDYSTYYLVACKYGGTVTIDESCNVANAMTWTE